MNIETDLVRLNENDPAPFSGTIIHNYHTYLEANGVYLQNRVELKVESVPVELIVGIDQMYGDDARWGDCLNGTWLKRIKRNLNELYNNPNYYLDDTDKAGMSFIKIENQYFIQSGKHRTVIARFLAHFNPTLFEDSPLKSIPVTEYFIDHEFTEMKVRLLELAKRHPQLEFEVSHTTDNDDLGFLLISEVDHKGAYVSFCRNQYDAVIEGLTQPSLREKWRSQKEWYSTSVYSFISYSQCFKHLLNDYWPKNNSKHRRKA